MHWILHTNVVGEVVGGAVAYPCSNKSGPPCAYIFLIMHILFHFLHTHPPPCVIMITVSNKIKQLSVTDVYWKEERWSLHNLINVIPVLNCHNQSLSCHCETMNESHWKWNVKLQQGDLLNLQLTNKQTNTLTYTTTNVIWQTWIHQIMWFRYSLSLWFLFTDG